MFLDYVNRTLTLEMKFLVGSPEGETEEERERMISGTITISGLQFCIVDAPQRPVIGGQEQDSSTLDGFPTTYENWPDSAGFPAVFDGNFLYTFLLFNWHAGIHIAARDAVLTLNPQRSR